MRRARRRRLRWRARWTKWARPGWSGSQAPRRALRRSLVHSYHYLGHRTPFGAHVRYLIRGARELLGCLQFSSPAWHLSARDQWIGWDEAQRQARLQHILCNSRFLILPWVRVPHLASHALAKAARQIAHDWAAHYAITAWLLETLVDPARYRGTCYRAANWLELGPTSGRGREDRTHQRHGAAPKQLGVYPLCPDPHARLCQGACDGHHLPAPPWPRATDGLGASGRPSLRRCLARSDGGC